MKSGLGESSRECAGVIPANKAGHYQTEKLPIVRSEISASDAYLGASSRPTFAFLPNLSSLRPKGFPPPTASSEPRGAADSSPGNSSGAGEGFGACSVPRAGFCCG